MLTSASRIKVIGPVKEDESINQKNGSNKALILGNKRYCPHDSSLLVYKPDIDSSFCTICGFVDGEEEGEEGEDSNKDQGSQVKPTISKKNLSRSTDSLESIGMDIKPMSEPRTIYKRSELSDDPDIRALQDRGITITDSYSEVREEGTYNVEEAMEDRKRLLSRNRWNSWSFY